MTAPGDLSGSIQPSAAFAALKARHEALRAELAAILAERLDLVGVILPNLEATYSVRLGDLELTLLHLDLEARGLRRAIELIQAELNRGELPDLDVIQERIQLELADWTRKVTEKAAQIHDAAELLSTSLPQERWAEMQGLFRGLARRLHPDVNPGLTPEELDLWHRAREAYEKRDLNGLKNLALILGEAKDANPAGPGDASAFELLERRCGELGTKIHEELRETERIKAARGYDRLSQVNDEAWIQARRAELEKKVAQSVAWRDALAAEVAQMHAGAGHQPRPD